jgi:hypothetical protein
MKTFRIMRSIDLYIGRGIWRFCVDNQLHHHHLPPWIRSFDLFRHRRVAIFSWGRQRPRLRVFAHEYFIFLGRVTSPSAKPPFLEDQFVSLSLASLLRPFRIGRFYQEHEVSADIARKVVEARKPPPPLHGKVETFGGDNQLIFLNYPL